MVFMLSARAFWLVSLFLLGFTTVFNLFINKIFPFGFFGEILLYAQFAGFLGFLLRKRWGYLASVLIQLVFLVGFVFPEMRIIEAVLQGTGIFILYLSRPYFD